MGNWLDIVGSVIIGSLVFVMIFAINGQMTSTSGDMNEYTSTQTNAVNVNDIFAYDLVKMGYRAKDDPIIIAQKNEIKFFYDIGDDSTRDSVYYYLGSESQLTGTPNPLDKIIYRKINGTAFNSGIVTKFELTYYDSLNNILNYTDLTTQTNRNKIKAIGYLMNVQNSFSTDSLYREIEWKRIVRPKNIN